MSLVLSFTASSCAKPWSLPCKWTASASNSSKSTSKPTLSITGGKLASRSWTRFMFCFAQDQTVCTLLRASSSASPARPMGNGSPTHQLEQCANPSWSYELCGVLHCAAGSSKWWPTSAQQVSPLLEGNCEFLVTHGLVVDETTGTLGAPSEATSHKSLDSNVWSEMTSQTSAPAVSSTTCGSSPNSRLKFVDTSLNSTDTCAESQRTSINR
mmetsp:Transcript_54145/g.144726  ORF Transcript_54145/g.144726 Transcript_54145/m.144726 type:complete len:212 (-) Transcript_54145:153-788(-)